MIRCGVLSGRVLIKWIELIFLIFSLFLFWDTKSTKTKSPILFSFLEKKKKKWSGVVLKGEYEEDEIIELNDGGGGIRMNEYNKYNN